MSKETMTLHRKATEDPEPVEDSSNSEGRETAYPDQDPIVKNWGVEDGYWLWPAVIRILLVIDGRIVLNKSPYNFGLGYILDTMRAPFSWWVRFEIDIARRIDTLDSNEALDGHRIKYQQFRFTDPGFDLDSYDQVWLFGDLPNFDDGSDTGSSDADIPTFGLNDAELKILADWMDRGGGVFATGDHSVLGASLSSRIPRVRTMRKWTKTQGAPTRDGIMRNETLQPNIAPGDPESDPLMQPVELMYQPVPGPVPFLKDVLPHPLLCSTIGPIDFFPDHMHEGELFSDADVALSRPLDIQGYDRPEYPLRVGPGDNPIQPRPHVIAFGRTTNGGLQVEPVSAVFGGNNIPIGPKRFGLVSVYDGDPANIGRVVVDSTWHHWLSINLAAHANFSTPLPRYQKMQAYYRNVGIWLARPAQRQTMVVAGTWGILTGSAPMEFSLRDNVWDIGERVLALFENTASPCIRNALADTVLSEFSRLESPKPAHKSEPVWSKLPVELTNRAVFGGLGSTLMDLALEHRAARAAGLRPPLDAEAIRKRAVSGISRAQGLVAKAVKDAAAAFNAINSRLKTRGLVPATGIQIPIDVQRVCVLAARMQFPEADDPALIGDQLTFTIRVTLDSEVVACRTFEDMKVPSFGPRGGILDLGNVVIGEFDVYAGETLSVEALAGNGESTDDLGETLRFRDAVRVDHSNLVGGRGPARRQVWRLWYSVEYSGCS
jgi:hypothetical protein